MGAGLAAQCASQCACSRGVARLLRGPGQVEDAPSFGQPINVATACTLRIIQITDVYVLENFPHLRTLVNEKRAELEARGTGSKTVSMLTGDFLAPYLLSSFDKGCGMMQMLNGTPIDILTWGNHEDDVGHAAVMQRESEYTGCWINTNMQSHASFKDSKCQVDAKVIEVESPDGSNKRKIGLIGILSDSPSLYKPNSFGGAKILDPWETMRTYKDIMEKDRACDVVVPLCHLYEPQDVRTAKEFDLPLILSGHDHHVVDRSVDGTRILKPGLDGHKAWMIDITWPSKASGRDTPFVEAQLLNVKDWPADPELSIMSEKAYAVLDPLRHTQLAKIPSQYRPLTSFNARGCRVSMGTYLLSRVRDALNMYDPIGGTPSCDCALLKGGNVRGGKDYAEDENLTLEVLQSELEETKEILIIPVPGFILRMGLRETWGVPNPGWMQYDDGVEVDQEGFVEKVNGQPLDTAKVYKVASIVDFWRKRDAPTIGAYFEVHPSQLPEHDSGQPIHALLIRLFAMEIWSRIWKALNINPEEGRIEEDAFARMDFDGDGKLSRQDIKKAIENIAGLETFAGQDVVVNQMFDEISAFKRQASVEDREHIHASTLASAAKHFSSSSLASMGDLDDSDEEVPAE